MQLLAPKWTNYNVIAERLIDTIPVTISSSAQTLNRQGMGVIGIYILTHSVHATVHAR
jgi:hypothetical protein